MSSRYLPQGPGAILPGRGIDIVELLESRDGQLTLVHLADGRVLDAFDCAAGRDMGAEWEHVTLNASPGTADRPIHLVVTSDIVRLVDPANQTLLYQRRDG
jgi:hypothetical protein